MHFVDKTWTRHDFPLGLSHFELDESKDASTIGNKITEKLEQFEIGTDQIIGMICDGAPVMPASARGINVKRYDLNLLLFLVEFLVLTVSHII